MTSRAGWELIATSFIFIPMTSIMNGTMTTPPPIPKKLDTIPAEALAIVIMISTSRVDLLAPLSSCP